MADIQEKTPLVSVITVNYKTEEYLKKLLKHIDGDRRVEIIVVDNSNSSHLSSFCEKLKNTTYIPLPENKGFSAANNIGIQRAKGEWVFLLNSDTDTSSEQIITLCDIAKNKNAQVAAPQLVYENGVVQNSVAYFDSLSQHPINFIFARTRFLDCTKTTNDVIVDFAVGGALLIHQKVFDTIGLLDEKRFFVYFEDLEFCQRLKRNGISILYTPSVSITHYEGQSSNQDAQQKSVNYNQGLTQYLMKERGLLITMLNNIFHFLA